MTRRIFYSIDPGSHPFDRVLIVESDSPSMWVYCPPGLANGPWLEEFTYREAAMDLAALLVRQSEQAAVLMTRDKDTWWLNGLTMIGDSDVRDRQEVD